jgi:hypothetical protein
MRAVCGGSLVACLLFLLGTLHADDQADAKALIDKALKAMGGAEKVAKLKAGVCKAKVTHQDKGTIDCEVKWQDRAKGRLDGTLTEGGQTHTLLFVFNGDMSWEKKDGTTNDAPEGLVSAVKNAFHALRMPHLLPDLKGTAFKLSPLGEVKVNDQAAVGVAVSHKDYKDVSVYFDKKTSLPVKSEIRVTDPAGRELTVEYFYSDFQEADGVKHPMKITMKADDQEFAIEISEIKAKDKLDDSEFAKP